MKISRDNYSFIEVGGENMGKIVRCEKCGAMVKVLIDCTCEGCSIKCCGETMKAISEEEAKKYLEIKQNKYRKRP